MCLRPGHGGCVDSFLARGRAQFLLECYQAAETSFLAGLSLQPSHRELVSALAGVSAVAAEARGDTEALAEARCACGMDCDSSDDDQMGERHRQAFAAATQKVDAGAGTGVPFSPEQGHKWQKTRPPPEGVRRARSLPLASVAAQAAADDEEAQAEEDAECTLCLKLLYDPVTTPCGHSFCRPCLQQALDHRNKCPLCRTVLLMSAASLQPSVSLQALLLRFFPRQTEERRCEEAAMAARLRGAGVGGAVSPQAAPGVSTALLPLFVMDVVLPHQRMSLNVFEPRYRLMVRRCMSGTRLFVMVGVDRERRLLEWATEVEIRECEALPDGRFLLDVVGRRRARILSTEEQDGYRLARCELETVEAERAQGVGAPGGEEAPGAEPGSAEAQRAQLARLTLPELAGVADNLLGVWTARLHSAGGEGAYAAHVERSVGAKPGLDQPHALSWWIAALLPLPPNQRYALLAAEGAHARLRHEVDLMSGAQVQGGLGSCAVM